MIAKMMEVMVAITVRVAMVAIVLIAALVVGRSHPCGGTILW